MTSGPELLERIRAATADEYQVDREIGRGGMAAVFLARDTALDRRVAIKVMLPDLINVQGVQGRFVSEARTAAHLDHPGIVAVYAVRQRAGLDFIVMKYIEGHTLEAVLRSQGQIDPTATALICGRVSEALSFAHGEGVVHRDVKPSNIMIDLRGRPVVTDFGIARVLTAQSVTVAGSMLGTPTHMSPEQCRGLPATAASDQYSLGVTMYEMLTGRVPFTGDLFELINAHRERTPPPLSDFVAGVDPMLEQTVMRMLAKNPAERWGSMAEVGQRLSSHTTVHRGDENLRATLFLSGEGSQFTTSERAAATADVLTPPGNVTPTTPSRAMGPPSPIPVSTPLSPVPVGSAASPARPDEVPHEKAAFASASVGSPPGGRVLLWSAAGILAVILAAAVYWGGKNSLRTAAPASRTDSAVAASPPPQPPPAISASRDSVARESIAKDSVAKVVAAKESATRDSVAKDSVAKAVAKKDSVAKALARRDSVVKDSVAKDSASKALAARQRATRARNDSSRARVDSAKVARFRPESLTVQCARLLERASLGEKLTDTERQQLRQRCPK